MSERIRITELGDLAHPMESAVMVKPQIIQALIAVAKAAHEELRGLDVPARGAFPSEDRLRDALNRFDFSGEVAPRHRSPEENIQLASAKAILDWHYA